MSKRRKRERKREGGKKNSAGVGFINKSEFPEIGASAEYPSLAE